MTDAKQVPFIELLRWVPADARLSYEHHPTSHSMFPVGRYCNEAADEIESLRTQLVVKDAEIARLREWTKADKTETIENDWQAGYEAARAWVRDVALAKEPA
jgi:hypothetical protein